MCWHCGITAWQNLCLLQFSLPLLPGLSQHLWSWASCSQHFQHLTPLQNCSSDGFKDFSSAAAASRQHCTVNIYLCVKPLQVSLPSALIEYHTSLVLYMVGPPQRDTKARLCSASSTWQLGQAKSLGHQELSKHSRQGKVLGMSSRSHRPTFLLKQNGFRHLLKATEHSTIGKSGQSKWLHVMQVHPCSGL